jgi:hypothetical protein
MYNHALYIQDLQSLLLQDKQTTKVIESFLGCVAINILHALSCLSDNGEQQMRPDDNIFQSSQDKIKVRWRLYRINVG